MTTSYDRENKNTFYYMDEFGLVLKQPLWEGDNCGKGDCLSRTGVYAYKAWGDIKFVNSIETHCMQVKKDKKGKYYWQLLRHPLWTENDMSRDHVVGCLLALKFTNKNCEIEYLSEKIRWRISDKYTFTIDTWAWMKILAGKWWWSPVFYIAEYPVMFFNMLWNKFWLWYGDFSPEVHPRNWNVHYVDKYATRKQLKIREWLYPTYALEGLAWMLYVLKPNIFMRGLQWIIRKIVSRYNFLIKLLANDTSVREIDVMQHHQMTGNRWTVTLNETCNRHVNHILKKEWIKANRLEEDILKAIWHEKQIMDN